MNPRILPLFALIAAIAACAYFFLWSDLRPSAAPSLDAGDVARTENAGATQRKGVSDSGSAGANPSSAAQKNPAVNWKRFAALMGDGDGGGESIPKPTPEVIARSLAKHGETAVNLVAAFETTRDRRLLDRALELFPNSPIVLMAAAEAAYSGSSPKPGETYQPDAQRMAFVERFKAADPNNPLPWIYSAQELFKAKQTGEAIAEIRAALERPAFYTYANERMDSAKQIYEDMGLSPVEAGVLAMAGLTMTHMSAAQQASRSLMEWQKAAAESGDAATVEDALRLTYDLGRTFATPEASRTLIGQLVGFNMEARALKAVPAGTQPDWLNVWPEVRLGEMEKQKQSVKELTAGLDWILQSQNEELLAEYLRRNRNDGEFSALTWLQAQRK